MQETLTLTDLEQLKAVADPLRQRMLEIFSREPTTTKQVAERLEEKPTKLYHHVNVLEAAGLLELVETRQNRGTVEKYYRATARQFVVDHHLLALSGQAAEGVHELHGLIVNTLQAGLSEARQCFDAERFASGTDCVPAIVGQTRIRTSKAQATRLAERLQAWLDDFRAAHDDQGEVTYGVTLAFHPVTSKPSASDHDENDH